MKTQRVPPFTSPFLVFFGHQLEELKAEKECIP